MFFYKLLFVTAVFVPGIISSKFYRVSDEFIKEINEKQSLWKAGRNSANGIYGLKRISAGTIPGTYNDDQVIRKYHDESKDVPDSFDAREAWPECTDIIGMVRDQSQCDACWAFSAAEAMSDRICIHSNGTKKLLVSAQDIVTCTSGGGCKDGELLSPWTNWISTGYVTGGLYNNTEQGCKSFFLPPCNDHPHKCLDVVDTPDCVQQCDNSELDYDSQRTYGQGTPTLVSGEKQLQLEIMENGPVAVEFSIYGDFGDYESGIYYHVGGIPYGTHAVKMLGWGVENGTKYWIIANSWNDSWGEGGFFRILRGTNECGIEDKGIAALPDLSRF